MAQSIIVGLGLDKFVPLSTLLIDGKPARVAVHRNGEDDPYVSILMTLPVEEAECVLFSLLESGESQDDVAEELVDELEALLEEVGVTTR